MQNSVRYVERPAWQFLLPRRAVFVSDGAPLYEYSPTSGEIRDLRSGEVLRPRSRFGGRDYSLPDGSTLAIRSRFTGGWTVERNGKKEEVIERWPSPIRRLVGTETIGFDCAIDSEQIYRKARSLSLEEVIIAFYAFYQAQPGDG